MINSVSYFEIQSSNLSREINFCRSIFGWNFLKEENSGINGGLLQRLAKTPPSEFGTNAFTCSVLVEDFDKTAEKIVELGGQIALPKFAIPKRC